MANKDAHKKSILTSTPPEIVGGSQPQFRKDDFNDALFDKGYEVYVEKGMQCPCKNKADGKPLLTCQNCGGTGWMFIDKKSTRLLLQSINRQTKFQQWTESDKGTVQITARGVDRLAFMDRITILDVDAVFSQITRIREHKGKLFAYLYYAPTEIEEVYMFDKDNKPLNNLSVGGELSVEENKLLINSTSIRNALKKLKRDDFITLSVRYKHLPTYNVIDINRDVMRNRAQVCGTNLLQEMPISAVGRKTHYMMDEPNLDGNSLFDNTVYGTIDTSLDSDDLTGGVNTAGEQV